MEQIGTRFLCWGKKGVNITTAGPAEAAPAPSWALLRSSVWS